MCVYINLPMMGVCATKTYFGFIEILLAAYNLEERSTTQPDLGRNLTNSLLELSEVNERLV